MNFPLKKMELHIDDAFIEQGEQYLDQGKVKALFEVDKHLWLAKVETEETFEVEIQITPSKVKAYTCECNEFFEKKICGDITAVLLALLRRLEFVEQRKLVKKSDSGPKKLTTSIIVDNISHDELKTFVRIYARTNRNFAIALKSRFARSITSMDNKDKYLQLLDTTINSVKRNSTKINNKGLVRLTKVLDELLTHASDSVAIKNFAEAFDIVHSILTKIPPLIKLSGENKDMLLQTLKESSDLLTTISEQDMAPQLRKNIWKFCNAGISNEVFLRNNMERPFFNILFKNTKGKIQIAEIIASLDTAIKQLADDAHPPKHIERAIASFLSAKLFFLNKSNQKTDIKAFLQSKLDQPEILMDAINNSKTFNTKKQAKKLVLIGIEIYEKNKIDKEALEQCLLDIAVLENDKESILQYAKKRFVDNPDQSYFELIKKEADSDWDGLVNQLIIDFNDKSINPENKAIALPIIYLNEKRFVDLLNFIEETNDFSSLKKYSKILIEADQNRAFQLYKKFIQIYLDSHIGRQASIQTKETISQLYDIEANEIAQKLLSFLRKNYADRNSLLQELGNLYIK